MTEREQPGSNRRDLQSTELNTATLPIHDGKCRMEAILARMIDQCCWACAGGYFTGSVLSLQLGQRIPFNHPKARTKEVGEYVIFIQNGHWRICRGTCGIVSSCDLLEGQRVEYLSEIENTVLRSASIAPDTLDLTLQFDDDLRMDIFCNYLSGEVDNYWVGDQHDIYGVLYVDRTLHVSWERKQGRQTAQQDAAR
jgi:hypothetical protein